MAAQADVNQLKQDLTRRMDGAMETLKREFNGLRTGRAHPGLLEPVKVHAYGVMAQWVLERYPFYSADSSNAIMGAGMGRVNRFVAGQLKSEGWQDDVRRTLDGVVADGIGRTGAKSQSAHAGRRRRNVEAQLALERYVTDLWSAKGVTWTT